MSKTLTKRTFRIIAIFIVLTLAVRCVLLLSHDIVFGEWSDLMDELSKDKPQEPHPFPLDYYMHSLFEVYAVKQFYFDDETGSFTEEQVREIYQPLVDEANKRFDGTETKIYVGHENPYNITPKFFPAKLYYWIDKIFGDNEPNTKWHIVVYKRARLPFWL